MTAEDKLAYCTHHGYSFAYYEYWAAHPACEVCGAESQPCHHLRTRGAGGQDTPENLLALCVQHHRMIHNVGDIQLGRMVGGAIQQKIMTAKKKSIQTADDEGRRV
jgi:hypothetical protein